eukprot:CAMPEP_0181176620 /NCGR_PEP_ID=MMETSP1096-20121128/4726_1 /TAXON_ID=156174 ORGANISM="Chrysochromulina ericina, Strain CCMP281" /NCGR_SAMPLE_ID=MMETSP1096 /ASSEMBLY_ACC=CAM_ASM_000453 /LENGTH=170 /DNA_ID=CAMNT_0023264719 /DNA_START=252 /DNA_END=764 /DNA_ORIENTATION=+
MRAQEQALPPPKALMTQAPASQPAAGSTAHLVSHERVALRHGDRLLLLVCQRRWKVPSPSLHRCSASRTLACQSATSPFVTWQLCATPRRVNAILYARARRPSSSLYSSRSSTSTVAGPGPSSATPSLTASPSPAISSLNTLSLATPSHVAWSALLPSPAAAATSCATAA